MKQLALDAMLKDGYSKKYAAYFLNIIGNENKNPVFDPKFVEWAHSLGFSAESASIWGLTNDNYKNYLSDYDYYKVWPLNNWTRIWINDKLTLRQVLSDKEFDGIMPRYYYYSVENGIRGLVDNPDNSGSIAAFLRTLQQVGEFACKPCNGTQSAGFFKLSYENGEYSINDVLVHEQDIELFVANHPNYVFTEYLKPAEKLKKYGSIIHTVRVITLNVNGDNPVIVSGYIRFPNEQSGVVNYISHDGTNNECFNIYTAVDFDTGDFINTIEAYPNKIVTIDEHPDTGASFVGERIPDYGRLKKLILGIAQKFNTIEYMGFDIGITDDGFKLMEINSHPGHAIPQIFHPFLSNPLLKEYFQSKLHTIDSFTEEQRKARNNLPR